jgi:hypothetical protein
MKKILLSFLLPFSLFLTSYGQSTGTITVGGDITKFYPVTWHDGGWDVNSITTLEIARSSVHLDATWRGAMSARFDFHVTNWGNSASFIDAKVVQHKWDQTVDPFVAGWQDATGGNNNGQIIVWLKGGGTTYAYKSNYVVSPQVYDGVQNALPYMQNSVSHSYKTVVESYVNSFGLAAGGTAYYNGIGTNAFMGNVGIGTSAPVHRLHVLGNDFPLKLESPTWFSGYLLKSASATKQLAVHYGGEGNNAFNTNSLRFGRFTTSGSWEANPVIFDLDAPDGSLIVKEDGKIGIGTGNTSDGNYRLYVEQGIRTRKVKVDQASWADYVFLPSYKLMTLPQVEAFIKKNGHLPEVPSEKEVAANGIDLGDTQTLLLKKIEELTLYIIEQGKKLERQGTEISELKKVISKNP